MSDVLAIQYVHGTEAMHEYVKVLVAPGEFKKLPTGLFLDTRNESRDFTMIHRKLQSIDSNSPGDLYLESNEQLAAFEWLCRIMSTLPRLGAPVQGAPRRARGMANRWSLPETAATEHRRFSGDYGRRDRDS